MDGITIARAIHVLAVLLWIGGVAFVTLVLMPSIRRGSRPINGWPPFTGSRSALPGKRACGC